MKKIIPLAILSAVLLAGCTVKDKEMEISVFDNPVISVYTGKVRRKVPDGEGTALLENSAKAEGIFEKGKWISGIAGNVPYSVTFSDQTYSGVYTGAVENELPSGSGTFESEPFSYQGTWINGAPQGEGTVSAQMFRIGGLEGSYSGDVSKGMAEGNGTFVYQSEDDEIEMRGSFAGNQYDGLFVKTIRHKDTERSYPVCYQKGEPLESAASMIAYLEGMRNVPYCISEAQWSFISDHSALFESSETGVNPPKDYNQTFDYSAFQESGEPALILIRNAEVRSVQRYKPYADAKPVTSMIVQNADGWYHLVFAYSADSADKGDTVDIYALPLCRSTLTAPEQDYPAIDAAGALISKPGQDSSGN